MQKEVSERFIVEGYVEEIRLLINPNSGKQCWSVSLDDITKDESSPLFLYYTYYEPRFKENDLIKVPISRKGNSVISSGQAYIVKED